MKLNISDIPSAAINAFIAPWLTLLIISILTTIIRPCFADASKSMTAANTALELNFLTEDAEKGNSLAQYLLGIHYWHEENFEQGLLWLKKAAHNGNVYAQYKLGREYGEGYTVESNNDISLKYYLLAIGQGYAPAQRQLGMCYYYAWQGYPEDLKKAFKYNLMAAEKGHVGGQAELASMYWLGKGVPVDREKSTYWKIKAGETRKANTQKSIDDYETHPLIQHAMKGNHLIGYLVGLHFSGQEEFIPQLGTRWINKASVAGNMYAQYEAGLKHLYKDFSSGKPKDINQALEYFTQSAKQGYAPAQYQIGSLYMEGKGIPLNQEKGISWLELAANNGMGLAQSILAANYYSGEYNFGDPKNGEWSKRPFPKDLEKSFKYYLMHAEKGDTWSQFMVGSMYFDGEGILQDYEQGITWLEKSAKNGQSLAQAELGTCYYFGNKGLKKDYKKAFKYSRMAAQQNHAQAQYTIGFMYMRGQGVIEDYKSGIDWLKKSALQGNENAQHELGLCYYRGTGVLQDYTEAYAWSLLAVMNGGKDTLKTVLKHELPTQTVIESQARAKELLKEIESENTSKN